MNHPFTEVAAKSAQGASGDRECSEPIPKREIRFLEIRYLNGPTRWTYGPIIEALIDIGDLENSPSNTIPGFYERLSSWLPTLIEHRCSYEERGGFLRRLREGTWPGHILEHVTLELQTLAGLPGGFGRARETSETGVYIVVVCALFESISRSALYAARDLILAAMDDRPYAVQKAVDELREMVESYRFGPSTASIVDAATLRKIPSIRLLEKGNLVQIGYGSRSRRIWTAETDRTGAIAESISRDKELTKSLLRSAGLPVPEGTPVHSPEEAWEVACKIGLPVVVKPADGNRSRGVFVHLTGKEEVEEAYRGATEKSSEVIVERCIPGLEHRLLIVDRKLVAASRSEAATITGNGIDTVERLIDLQINSDPRRGDAERIPLPFVRIDRAVSMEIHRQGYQADSIVPAGKTLLIQRIGNHSFDVTDQVHPDVVRAAALAARIVGLDIAGVDIVCEDISQPLGSQGGAIIEVNAGPGLGMHLDPGNGEARPVGRAIVDHLFPEKSDGRIPIVGVTGSYGKTSVARLVARMMTLSGMKTGLASSEGLFLDHRIRERGDRANHNSAKRILMNRTVDAAVFENGFASILREGLAYDLCTIGVVTNVDPEIHLGKDNISTVDHVFSVFRTPVDVVMPTGFAILNAEDPLVMQMVPLCDGEVVLFGLSGQLPAIAGHISAGKSALYFRDGAIVLSHGGREEELMKIDFLSPGHQQKNQKETILNLLAATGAAWALGLTRDVMEAGIQSLFPDKSE